MGLKWEEIDLDKVAEFLLDNGVDINVGKHPYSALFKSCLNLKLKADKACSLEHSRCSIKYSFPTINSFSIIT